MVGIKPPSKPRKFVYTKSEDLAELAIFCNSSKSSICSIDRQKSYNTTTILVWYRVPVLRNTSGVFHFPFCSKFQSLKTPTPPFCSVKKED